MSMADSCDTIGPVTQGTDTGCPPSNGTVSAMSVESVSAINGMRKFAVRASTRREKTHTRWA
jgi:hypothetical protein